MAFQVPASNASKGQDQFEFEIGGAAYRVRRAKFVPIDQLFDIETSISAALEFFGKSGTKQGTAVRGLDRDQYTALVDAWRVDSEVTSGEPQASAD